MSRTQVIALVSAIALFIIVLELVRQRRLREEYSWLWLLAASFYLLVALWPPLSKLMASFIGTTNTALAFVYFGLQFVVLILIQYSVRLSKLTTKVKDLAQQIAILGSELDDLTGLLMSEDGDSQQKTSQVLEQSEILKQRIDLLDSELNKLSTAYK